MADSHKAEAIIGFAVRANKVIYGLDMLKHGKRKRYLIIYSPLISDSSLQEIKAVAERDNVPLICSEALIAATHKSTCKVIGIANKQMSESIINYTGENIADSKELIKSEEI